MSLLNHCFIKKRDNKKNLFYLFDLSNFEIIFALLAKTIIFSIKIHRIKIRKPSFKKLFTKTNVIILLWQFINCLIYLDQLLTQSISKNYNKSQSRSIGLNRRRSLDLHKNRGIKNGKNKNGDTVIFNKRSFNQLIFIDKRKITANACFSYQINQKIQL